MSVGYLLQYCVGVHFFLDEKTNQKKSRLEELGLTPPSGPLKLIKLAHRFAQTRSIFKRVPLGFVRAAHFFKAGKGS